MTRYTDNVVSIGGDLPADQVLRRAIEAGLDQVVVIGWGKDPHGDGRRFWVSSSMMHDPDVLYAIQHANLAVIEASR